MLPAGGMRKSQSSWRCTMSEAVKTRRMLNVRFKRTTPARVLRDIRTRYRKYIAEDDSELVEWRKTGLHKEISSRMGPGDRLRELRTVTGLTLQEIGDKAGFTPQRIYEMESGRRGVSKNAARRFAEIFGVAPGMFI
ncbi:MAG: helix-turn-helix domain-containing protein [Chitinivibrionales bacterium]|nr:helix-turn-helix domain-containing protein [Chitinivibrionales bacterium]MBD3396854.1 helix-turn-helix domain-containing protein [Chitinivibrionales bacterium]